jgi:hypothetical protein
VFSWSYSRQQAFNRCERAFNFQYYPWDEPDTAQARFLSRIKTHEQVAGDAVHWAVAIALKTYRFKKTDIPSLAEPALQRYKETCSRSRWIVDHLKRDRKPPTDGAVLHADVYGYDARDQYKSAKDQVERCVKNFRSSAAWKFIKTTNSTHWFAVDPDHRQMSKFKFEVAPLHFVTVYAGYDFAFRHDGLIYIVDWKTGHKTPMGAEEALRQLAVYGLHFINHPQIRAKGVEIRTQAIWLEEPSVWNPEPISTANFQEAEHNIKTQFEIERARNRVEVRKNGEIITIAERSAYQCRPELPKCAGCKFGLICSEGKDLVQRVRS